MPSNPDPPKDVLVALLPDQGDYAILRDQGWYRLPVESTPKDWPPRWLAFYQPKAFGEQAYRVELYGKVEKITPAARRELFPNEIESARSNKLYHQIYLESLERRETPILSTRPRRLLFVPTTWEKFDQASQINDLFADSPLEDSLWEALRRSNIAAERQWLMKIDQHNYLLDFAIFCRQGFLDVEADGDTWHAQKARIPHDNQRNNALARIGWRVLRFNGEQIKKVEGCLREVKESINTLGGLTDDGLAPRVFYTKGPQPAQQLSLFEPAAPYEVDLNSGSEWNLEG